MSFEAVGFLLEIVERLILNPGLMLPKVVELLRAPSTHFAALAVLVRYLAEEVIAAE